MEKGLKAIELLYALANDKKDSEFKEKYEIKTESDLRNFVKEAIIELEQYEQKFKDKEFDYRTKCQNIVSAARLEADDIAKGGVIDPVKFTEDTLQVIKELENQNTFYKSIGYESDGTE